MRTASLLLLLVLQIVAFAGCKSSAMEKASSAAMMTPTADSAVIVFLRPSTFGGAYQSVVYDVTTSENELVGIVSSGAKIGYRATPGEHTFMVVSEAADFLKANVEANKTYHVLVSPRMGAWRARFSLKPVRAADLSSKQFQSWDRSTKPYENTEKSRTWAANNASSVQAKRAEYQLRWDEKSPEQKAEVTLLPSDGQ